MALTLSVIGFAMGAFASHVDIELNTPSEEKVARWL